MTISEALKPERIQEGVRKVVRKMLDNDMSAATVKQITGLTDSDILKLKK